MSLLIFISIRCDFSLIIAMNKNLRLIMRSSPAIMLIIYRHRSPTAMTNYYARPRPTDASFRQFGSIAARWADN